jgi:hypothetical protein
MLASKPSQHLGSDFEPRRNRPHARVNESTSDDHALNASDHFHPEWQGANGFTLCLIA